MMYLQCLSSNLREYNCVNYNVKYVIFRALPRFLSFDSIFHSTVSLLLQDPHLLYHCVLGPCTSYQYRLMGPGAWPGARDAILGQMDRFRYPLTTRGHSGVDTGVKSSLRMRGYFVYFISAVVFLLCFCIVFL